MSLVADILRSYRAPRRVVEDRLPFATEGSALGTLMVACALIFVSQWPGLARAAHFDPTVPLDARLGGALFGLMFVLPLLAYGLAGGIWVLVRMASGPISGLSVRFALFWALFAASPLWLLYGLASGFDGKSVATEALGLVALLAFLAILVGGLRAVGAQSAEV